MDGGGVPCMREGETSNIKKQIMKKLGLNLDVALLKLIYAPSSSHKKEWCKLASRNQYIEYIFSEKII